MIRLTFEKGTIAVRGGVRVPNTSWDSGSKCFRGMALHYRDITGYLRNSGIPFEDKVLDPLPCPNYGRPRVRLRGYQRQALEAWHGGGNWGTIVLPTGAGKTFVAIKAISELNESTLVVVPTLELMEQWAARLKEELGVEVGIYGGGSHELKALTVATYDSAYLRAEELGNRYPFLVFDEVHHLPAPSYSAIAELFASPYRMGLTATYDREDGLHKALPRLVGGKLFELEIHDLAGKHLANYDLRIINTDLTPEEKKEYVRCHDIYRRYLQRRGISLRTPADFQRFVMLSGRDPKAREALLARHQARVVALNSKAKIEALRTLLREHLGDRMLIFTEHNKLVQRISKIFLLPAITHRTPKEERKHNLACFREGVYRVIVTSKVLDEGIDVPEANVGVILSGTGSTREYRQRLGRLLRKKNGKKAVLYEIVSRNTSEVMTSKRRHGSGEDKRIDKKKRGGA
jgi:superfamily II DNA or RNA helicase